MFNESVSFYARYPHRGRPLPPPPLFLVPTPPLGPAPPVLPPHPSPTPSVDSGVAATRGACPGGTGSGGANIGCADTGSAGARGAGVGGAGSRGYSTGGAGSRGAGVGGASSGGAAAATPAPGVPCYLSRFQLHYQQQLRSSLPLVSGLRLLGLPSLLPGHSLPLPEYGPPFSPLDVSLARSPPWSLQSPLLPPSPSRLTSSWTTRRDPVNRSWVWPRPCLGGANLVVGCTGECSRPTAVGELVDEGGRLARGPLHWCRLLGADFGVVDLVVDGGGADVDLDRGGHRAACRRVERRRLRDIDLATPTWGRRRGWWSSTREVNRHKEKLVDEMVARSTKLPERRSSTETRDIRPGVSGKADLCVVSRGAMLFCGCNVGTPLTCSVGKPQLCTAGVRSTKSCRASRCADADLHGHLAVLLAGRADRLEVVQGAP
ncbi:unnamed protein product [Closterium sp. NIES-53]